MITAVKWKPPNRNQIMHLRESLKNGCRFSERGTKVLELLFMTKLNKQRSVEIDVIIKFCYDDDTDIDDQTVRAQIRTLRGQFADFFRKSGRSLPWEVQILNGEKPRSFCLAFIENVGGYGDCVTRFWRDYFAEDSECLVLLRESLFFHDGKSTYVRNFHVNKASDRSRLYYFAPKNRVDNLVPSYHYVSSGQVAGAFHLISFFYDNRKKLRFENAGLRQFANLELKTTNLILLGNGRTNPLFDQMSVYKQMKFKVDQDRVLGEKDVYNDDLLKRDGDFRAYAVVTRKPNLNHGSTITAVAANHGRAVEGACEFLTRQYDLESLFKKMNLSPDSPLPLSFQAILRVSIRREQGEIQINETAVEEACVYGA